MEGKQLTIQTLRDRRTITLLLTATGLTVKQKLPKPLSRPEVPHQNVLIAEYNHETRNLKVAYLGVKKCNNTAMAITEGEVQGADVDIAAEWAEAVMRYAYDNIGVKRARKLKVLVNPHGGVKRGVSLFQKVVEPILRTANCNLDVIYTTHPGHAHEIVKILPLDFDAVITVSGDGLIHEVMNGFAQHQNPVKAFSIPVAPIPTGSGNGLSLNLTGLETGFDVSLATLNVIKGRPMKIDLFSVVQDGKRTISFMSQALGLMADLDIGTEHLRWMGDLRFMVGLLRGIIHLTPCPVQLSYKAAETDKHKMAEAVQSRRTTEFDQLVSTEANAGDELPPLQYSEDKGGWTTFNEPLLYIYAGKGPYVGRDFMAFPVSLPDDGLIDLMVVPLTSRKDVLSCIAGAHKGDSYWHPKVHYVKAHSYRVKPLQAEGNLAVDGEAYPFKEYHVEVHKGLGTVLSTLGHYAAEFAARKPGSK